MPTPLGRRDFLRFAAALTAAVAAAKAAHGGSGEYRAVTPPKK